MPTRGSGWRLATVILIVLLALTGCGLFSSARVTINDQIQPGDVTFIVSGKTTFTEVVAQLGAPDELTGTAHGAVSVYHFRDAKYSRVNFGWPLRFFLPVSPDMVLAGGGLGTDVFQVFFDSQWVAQTYAFAYHSRGPSFNPWPF